MAVIERPKQPADQFIFNVTLALLAVGVAAVFDASYARSMDLRNTGNDAFFFLKRQAVFAAIGLACMLAMSRFNYWKLKRFAGPVLIASIFMLAMVWLPTIGITRNGASRWIGYGPIQLQPSEVAKLALVVYLAAILSRGAHNIRSFWDGLFIPLAVIGAIVVLVEREPDLGTAFIILMASLTLLYLAGARKRHLGGILATCGVLFVLASLFSHSFRAGRIQTFLNPDSDPTGRGYQISHGLMAVGSGRITGVGLGAGREKFYIPEANTDFIFATIAEETGLVGCLIVIGLLAAVGLQGFRIASRTRDPFGSLLAAGIAAMISWQAIVNIAVVTGSIPATGVPLPFISYGGSSVLFLLIGIGILLNISQHPDASPRLAERR